MSYDAPPPPPPQQPPYGSQPPYGGPPPSGGYQGPPPNHPRAAMTLVLGILALVLCGIFTGVPAIIVGNRATREIDASQGAVGGRGMVRAGVVLGWISVVWSVLVLILVVVAASSSGG